MMPRVDNSCVCNDSKVNVVLKRQKNTQQHRQSSNPLRNQSVCDSGPLSYLGLPLSGKEIGIELIYLLGWELWSWLFKLKT